MRLTKRQLRTAVSKLIREDNIDTELDHLKKNVADDLDHIADLHDDIKDDHEEEVRAEKEEHKHESRRRRRGSKKVGYHQLRRIIREQSVDVRSGLEQKNEALKRRLRRIVRENTRSVRRRRR
jgi:hypothetical protein